MQKPSKAANKTSFVALRQIVFMAGVTAVVPLLLLAQSASPTAANSETALVAHYPMTPNETNVLIDISTNQYNGQLTLFNPQPYVPGPGTNSSAVSLPSGGVISVSLQAKSLQTNSYSAFTFSTWFRGLPSEKTTEIASGTDTATNSWALTADTNGVANLTFYDAQRNAQILPSLATNSITDGSWHQLTATVSQTNALVYVDNAATEASVQWAGTNSVNLSLGSTNNDNPPFLMGDTHLFDRPLAPTEVAQLPGPGEQISAATTTSDLNKPQPFVSSSATPRLSPASGQIHPLVSGSNILTITAGNNQIVPSSTFATGALQVKLTTSSGTPISGTSIAFSFPSGSDGGLATTSGGSTATTQTVTTNSSGIATIYYQSGSDLLKNNSITATDAADSLTQTFTEHCGTQTGLQFWVAADQGITQSGGAVSQWNDLSKNGNNVTQTGSAQPTFVTSDINGQPALHFNGSQNLYNPNSLGVAVNADLTILTVSTTSNIPNTQFALALGQATASTGRGLGYGGSLEYFVGWSNDATGAPVPNANLFNVEAVSLDPTLTHLTFSRNGIVTATPTISGLHNVTPGINVGTGPSSNDFWQGDIAEVLVYDHQLTTAELAKANLYLANKYGLYSPQQTGIWYNSAPYNAAGIQSEIIRNQWNKTQANAYIALQSNTSGVVTNGLLSWFHADTISGLANGAAVTNLTDSALGNSVTQGTVSAQPTFVTSDINGQPALHFNGAQNLYNPNSLGVAVNADLTILTVSTTSKISNTQFALALGQATASTARGLGYGGSLEYFVGWGNDATGAPAPNANSFSVEALSLDPTLTHLMFSRNGIVTSTPTISGLHNVTPGINVGTGPSSNDFWQGDIAEVLVYDHQLTTAELAKANLYLANKYGLYSPQQTGIWYNSAPYNAAGIQSEIIRNQWSKTQADTYIALQNNTSGVVTHGLISWYAAGAVNGLAANGTPNTLPTNGALINSWTDLALGNSVTTSGSQPTFVASDTYGNGGRSAVRFNGSQGLANSSYNLPSVNSDMSIVYVGSTSNPGNHQYAAWLGNNSTASANRGVGYYQAREIGNASSNYVVGTSAPPTNTFASEIMTLNSAKTQVDLYQNGILSSNGSISGWSNIIGAVLGIGTIPNFGDNWQGDISEVLIYDHQLSTSEISQISLYLANKYGLYSPQQSGIWYNSAPYNAAGIQSEIIRNQWNKAQADAYVTFVAANPPVPPLGLALWFKADAGVTQSGGNVSAWTDQRSQTTATLNSTNSPTLATHSLNGMPGLVFNGTQRLSSTAYVPLDQDVTIITVGSSNDTQSERYMLGIGNLSTSLDVRGFGNSGGGFVFTTNGSYIIKPPYLNTGEDNFSEVVYTKSNSTATIYTRGGNLLDSGSVSSGKTTYGFNIGDISNGNYPRLWNGNIHEILVYNRVLTSTETQQAQAYLADKYGLYNANATWPHSYTTAVQAEITRNQWNKAQADAYVTFVAANPPVPPLGLALWFKADAGVTQSSGNVSAWTDQRSQTTATLNSTNSPTLATHSLNGMPGLVFNGTQRLSSTAYVTLDQDVTIITVGSSNDTQSERYMLGIGNLSTSLDVRGFGNSGGGFVFTTNTSYIIKTPYLNTGEDNFSEVVYTKSNSTATIYTRGGNLLDSGSVSSGKTTYGFNIGDISNGNYPRLWNGNIHEILVYNRVLTSTETQQAQAYLADKYGLYNANATWPHSYTTAVQAEITRNQWNKAQADAYVTFVAENPPVPPLGLALWFKADAGVTQSSGNVSAWTDQRSQTTATLNSTNSPTLATHSLNGMPGLVFNGTQRLSSTAYVPLDQDVTIITVGSSNDTQSERYMLGIGNLSTSLDVRGFGNSGGGFVFTTNTSYIIKPPYLNTGEDNFSEVVYTKNNSTATIYTRGGNLLDSGSVSSGKTTYGFNIGDISNGNAPRLWNGNIHEILVYNRVLTSTETQQAEVYLANKYNLALTLPAPTITPNGGNFASTVSVSFSPVYSPAVIRYTLDGSVPTSASKLYTGAFNLTSSAPLSAAIFLNNVMVSPVATAQFYVGDSGGIGISDAWQTQYFGHTGINPATVGINGLTYLQDYLYGYNPTLYSTNGDGLSDQVNHLLGFAGTNTDIDGDGISNAQELLHGTDPFNSDTDGDGWFDGPGNTGQYASKVDYYPLDPTRHSPPADTQPTVAPVITLINPPGAVLVP